MRQVFRFDANGFLLEPVLVEDDDKTPIDCTDIQPVDGFYKAQFVNGAWVEGATQEEINAIKNEPQPLSDIEQMKKQQADLTFTLMLNGVI